MLQERPPLKCINNAKKVEVNWRVSDSHEKQTKFTKLVAQSGLLPLIGLSYSSVDKAIVLAFVERWHHETNTFHMTFGEMTITLDDVSTILGIRITGKAIACRRMTNKEAQELLVKALGVSAKEAHEEITSVRGQTVGLEWLKKKFSSVTKKDNDHAIQCAARVYLLYLLGCTIFSDKSGSRVSVTYLNLLIDLEAVHLYAWGAAALAFLYRQLGLASLSCTRQMAGYLTLLKAWIFEHFPNVSRAHPNFDYKQNQPHAKRWYPRKDFDFTIQHLQEHRELIDAMRPEDVLLFDFFFFVYLIRICIYYNYNVSFFLYFLFGGYLGSIS